MIPLQVLEAVRIKSCLTHLFPFFLSIPTSVMSADSAVKNQPASAGDAGDMGSIPGLVRSLEKEMATCSRILAWRIPWTEEPGGLQLIGFANSQTRLKQLSMRAY